MSSSVVAVCCNLVRGSRTRTRAALPSRAPASRPSWTMRPPRAATQRHEHRWDWCGNATARVVLGSWYLAWAAWAAWRSLPA
eukprot:14984805-Alexandrium_andersonii.AAC.1